MQTIESRDETYKNYLDRIAQLYFGLPPPPSASKQGGMQGILGQLFKGGRSGYVMMYHIIVGMMNDDTGNGGMDVDEQNDNQSTTNKTNNAPMQDHDDLD